MKKDRYDALKKCDVKCKCGHSVTFLKGLDRMVCHWCGKYVYKNKQIEFKYKLNERIKEK